MVTLDIQIYVETSTQRFIPWALSSSLLRCSLLDMPYNNGVRFGGVISIALLAKHAVGSLEWQILYVDELGCSLMQEQQIVTSFQPCEVIWYPLTDHNIVAKA